MNIADASSRIDVVAHAEPAEWWQILVAFTPLAAILGITAVIVWYAVRGLASSGVAGVENRSDWWDRAEWALDMALDDNPARRNVGLAVLEQLGSSNVIANEDAKIVAQAKALLNRR